MKLRTVLHISRFLLTLAVLAAGAWYVYSRGEEIAVLSRLGVGDFLLVVSGLGAVFVATGYTLFLLVRATGVRLDVSDWIGLTFVSNALNYLVPVRPGLLAKATYLKRKTSLSYSRFSAVLLAKGVLFVGTTALLGIVVLVWLHPPGRVALLLAAACAAMVAGAAIPLYMPLFRFRRKGRLFELLNNAVHGFEEIRDQRGLTLLIGLSIVLQHLLSAFTCIAAFSALGFEMGFPLSLALVAFASIANVLAITPNNIGVQELVMAYVYTLAGLDFEQGLLGAALVRAGHVVLTFAVAPWFTYRLVSAKALRLGQVLSDDRRIP